MGAYGYGPGCCQPLTCGWTPTLTNTILRPLSGSLSLVLASGGTYGMSGAITAVGTGVTVAEGDVGTSGVGADLRLVGQLYPYNVACCTRSFTVDMPELTTVLTRHTHHQDARTLTFDYYGTAAPYPVSLIMHGAYDCVWKADGGGGLYDQSWIGIVKQTGLTLVIMKYPTTYMYYNGYASCGGGTVDRDAGLVFIPPAISDTWPATIDIVPVAPSSDKVWIGVKNSAGIAYEPATRKWSAVILGGDGNIDTTIAEVATTIATDTPAGAFWWSDEQTVQFGWHDFITDYQFAYSGGVREIKDIVAIDYAMAQPSPKLRTGYVGASGPFASFRAGLSCYRDLCGENYTGSPGWLQRGPGRYYLFGLTGTGGVGCSTSIPFQFQLLSRTASCHWDARIYRPVDQYWLADIGQKNPNRFTLEVNGSGGAKGIWETSLTTAFDWWRPFTVNKVTGSDSGSTCLFPDAIEMSPG